MEVNKFTNGVWLQDVQRHERDGYVYSYANRRFVYLVQASSVSVLYGRTQPSATYEFRP
jgi:hypothetical protein